MLSEFQKRKIALAFYKYDTSKDGFVELSDLELQGKKVAELQNVKPGSAEYEKIMSAYKGVWDNYIQSQDEDGDNKVTLDEFTKSTEQFINAGNSASTAVDVNGAVFDSIDLDGSGKIDSIEFSLYLRAVGLSETDAKAAFEKLDTDRDGFIFREDFAQKAYEYYTSNDPEAPGNWFYGSF